ncbi:hypothetical protein lerEdw1_009977 [Lerista edwardsae]|nr:hypothetical protein lerEdw1_009977 [Lerista edwardsae]
MSCMLTHSPSDSLSQQALSEDLCWFEGHHLVNFCHFSMACTILSSLFQAAPARGSPVTTTKVRDMNFSVPVNTAQEIQPYGPNSVEISPSGNISLPPGSSLNLTCRADSVPLPQYSWFFNNISRNVTGDCFTINSTSLEDEGVYTCWAYNDETNKSLWASVMVTISPGSSSAHLGQILEIASAGLVAGVSAGLVVAVVLLTVVVMLLYRFYSKHWGENSALTGSTSEIYDDASPAAHGTKLETSADLPNNPYQTLQYGDEAIYEEPQK